MSPHKPESDNVNIPVEPEVTVIKLEGFETSAELLTQPVASVISALQNASNPQTSVTLTETLNRTGSTRQIKDVQSLILTASNHIANLAAIQIGLGARPCRFIWHNLLRALGTMCCEKTEVINDAPFIGPRGYNQVYHAPFLLTFAITGNDLDTILTKMIPPVPKNKALAELSPANIDKVQAEISSKDSTTMIDTVQAEISSEVSTAMIDTIQDLDNKEPSLHSDDYIQEEYNKNNSKSLASSFDILPFTTVFNPCHKFASYFANSELASQELPHSSSEVDIPYNMHIFSRSIFKSTHIPILCVADADNIVPLMASLVCLYYTWQISAPVIGLQTSQFDGKVAVYIGYMSPINNSEKLHIQIRAPLSQDPTLPSFINTIGWFDLSKAQSATQFSTFILSMQSHFSEIKSQIEAYSSGSIPQLPMNCIWKSYKNLDLKASQTLWTRLISELPQKVWDTSSVISWMLERDSYPILKAADIIDLMKTEYSIEVDIKPDNLPIKIKTVSSIYNHFLKNHWIEEWNSENRMPYVYQDLSQIRAQLYSRYTKLDKSHIIFLSNKSINEDILIQELSVLLDNVKQLNLYSYNSETNYENIWDILLYSFYRDNTRNCSILYNQKMKLPQNCGEINDTDHWILLQKLNNWTNQIHNTYQHFDNTTDEDLECQCSILQYIAEFSVCFLPELSGLNKIIHSHSLQDPLYGSCDISLFTTYQMEFQAQERSLQVFKEMSPFFYSQDQQYTSVNVEATKNLNGIQVILPQLTVAYTKSEMKKESTFKEACMQSVATAKYLSSLGIIEFPVFALAIYKTFCGVIMARTSADNMTYVVTHNIKTYNIADPFDAFQFALFLMRLKSREEELREIFKKNEEKAIEALRDGSWAQWSMSDAQGIQEAEYELESKGKLPADE